MDVWLELARGPLFRLSLAVFALGLAYHVGNALFQVVTSWRRAGDRDLPLRAVVRATVRWLLPVRLLRARPLYSVASIVFHAGIVLLPLFLLGHVALWQTSLAVPWPVLPRGTADALTIATLLALAGVLVGRAMMRAARALSRFQDLFVLVLLLCLIAAGFLAAHPRLSPFDARDMLLVHVLLGDLTLVLTPATKLVHCALVPFTQLLSELAWHFPADSGRHVATVLGKENEPV
jgi:nitrate reductase gamma subunit